MATTARKTWKSRSTKLSSEQLFQLQIDAGNMVDEIVEYFGLNLNKNNKFYVGTCPIHGGDNESAFNIFYTGEELSGNWRCFTHHCEDYFKSSIIGFVRGIISHNKYGWRSGRDENKICPFAEAVDFLVKITGNKSIKNIITDNHLYEKQKFVNQIKNFYFEEKPESRLNISKDIIRSSLNIPSKYFLSRGFSKETLIKYDIGDCIAPGKPMNMRAVVPVYDNDYNLVIGCSGRSLFERCSLCNSFHNPTHECPEGKKKGIYRKWKHNSGFRADRYLYNYWFAKDFIEESGVAIIVEGPGDVWKLEEAGIHNSIAIFGSSLNPGQRNVLDNSGALALLVLTDPDDAGRLCIRKIKEECAMSYSIYDPTIGNEDIGDTPVSLLKEKLIPIIKNIEKDLR